MARAEGMAGQVGETEGKERGKGREGKGEGRSMCPALIGNLPSDWFPVACSGSPERRLKRVFKPPEVPHHTPHMHSAYVLNIPATQTNPGWILGAHTVQGWTPTLTSFRRGTF